mmetsp:Transcript_1911/g.2647  ORF Transcript_1911/g.2647 Transcript_1911/m.2647 type:complete len:242 (-) Transcript_1911:135-860(-)
MATRMGSSRRSANVTLSEMFKDVGITPEVKNHLFKVHALLAFTIMCAALGSACHVLGIFSGGIISMVGSIGGMITVSLMSQHQVVPRLAMMSMSGFFTGCSIGPLVGKAIELDPSLLVTALLGTAAIFACFSMAAITSSRRSMVHLGGMLGSGTMLLLVIGVMRMFSGSEILNTVYLYLGLLVFSGYVAFDTQMIILKVGDGISNDYIWHAMELFTDFIGIFVRILAILVDDKKKKNKKRS